MPNGDVNYTDVEVMKLKPKMPVTKRKGSRHGQPSKTNSGHHGLYVQPENEQSTTAPLSPAIRRSAINNLVGVNTNSSTSSTDESKYSIRNEGLPDMRSQSNKNTPEGKRFNVRVGSMNA